MNIWNVYSKSASQDEDDIELYPIWLGTTSPLKSIFKPKDDFEGNDN